MAWTQTNNFIADALNVESRDAFASAYGWEGATILDATGATVPNPRGVTKLAFRDWCVKNYIKEVVKGERVKAAKAAADASIVAVPD